MNLNTIYSNTLQLVDNPAVIEAIYKEKEPYLSDENKLRLADWLSFFNEHKDDFSNIYSGTICAIFTKVQLKPSVFDKMKFPENIFRIGIEKNTFS